MHKQILIALAAMIVFASGFLASQLVSTPSAPPPEESVSTVKMPPEPRGAPPTSRPSRPPAAAIPLAPPNTIEKPAPAPARSVVPVADAGVPVYTNSAVRRSRFLDRHEMTASEVTRSGDRELLVASPHRTYYIDKTGKSSFRGGKLIVIGFREGEADFELPAAGFVKIDGKAVEIAWSVSSPQIISLFPDGSGVFEAPGSVTVSVGAGSLLASITLDAVAIPIVSDRYGLDGTRADELIQLLGFPDVRESHVFNWPTKANVEGIWYFPDPGSGISVEHWKYAKYPGAVISIMGNRVIDIGTFAPPKRNSTSVP